MKNIIIVKTTCPTEEMANMLAETLVFEKLAACVQIGAAIKSLYVWKGENFNETEYPLSIKTSTAMLDKVESRVKELHSYECPQWIVLEANASDAYADWVSDSTR